MPPVARSRSTRIASTIVFCETAFGMPAFYQARPSVPFTCLIEILESALCHLTHRPGDGRFFGYIERSWDLGTRSSLIESGFLKGGNPTIRKTGCSGFGSRQSDNHEPSHHGSSLKSNRRNCVSRRQPFLITCQGTTLPNLGDL